MNHEGLDEVTKLSISHFENTYSYDAFLEDKANKDNKFAQEKEEEEEERKWRWIELGENCLGKIQVFLWIAPKS